MPHSRTFTPTCFSRSSKHVSDCSLQQRTLKKTNNQKKTTHRFLCHQPSHNQQNQGPSTVFFEQNGCLGRNRGDFHVQMSVSQLPAITGPSSPEIGGLRHSLNNLAALCLRAFGSQPSKVMTERRWLTSPSHSLPLPLIYRY